jgi:hypothetical protein
MVTLDVGELSSSLSLRVEGSRVVTVFVMHPNASKCTQMHQNARFEISKMKNEPTADKTFVSSNSKRSYSIASHAGFGKETFFPAQAVHPMGR